MSLVALSSTVMCDFCFIQEVLQHEIDCQAGRR